MIELMVVVAIIGVIAAIATVKFADLIDRSRESSIKYNLGALRSAVSIYYADNEMYPATGTLEASLVGKYLERIPPITVPPPADHPRRTAVLDYAGAVTDTGAWMYDMPRGGQIFIDCLHAGVQGRVWSTW